MRILALDAGTSSVKAAVLDVETANPVGPVARSAYALDHPTPDAAAVPAERLWQAVTAAARGAALGVEGVEAVGLSSLTPALLLLGVDDRPLGPIWTHLDHRARMTARQVWGSVGEEFLAAAGNRPLPGGITAVSYLHQLNEDPYLYDRVRSYLHANGWLVLCMTGERAFDPGNACYTGLFGTLTDQAWSPRWCEFFEVEPAWLPPVVDGRTTVGTLRSAVATELGVPAGLPVKIGTADTTSAMLAAGMQRGDLLHMVGTTQFLAALTDQPRPAVSHLTRLFGAGPGFLHCSHNPVGGVALDWLRELCFREQAEEEFYERTVPAALARETIVTLDPPYLGGDRLEIEARRAAFRDLTLSTDRLDLLAAVLHEMRRQHGRAVAALGLGNSFRRIFLSGGAAAIIHRLIPEYAGAAVHMLEEGSLRGVARLFG